MFELVEMDISVGRYHLVFDFKGNSSLYFIELQESRGRETHYVVSNVFVVVSFDEHISEFIHNIVILVKIESFFDKSALFLCIHVRIIN